MKDRESRHAALAAGQEARPERWTVDALEDAAGVPGGRVARLERADGVTFTLPLRDLPDGVREGDVLAVQAGADGVRARVLRGETARRRERAQARLDHLNAQPGNPGPDGEIPL